MNHLFRISLSRVVFALAALLFVSSIVFAGEPVPGADVGAGKNSGGGIINTKTDAKGKFAFPPADSGLYNLTFPNDAKFMPFILQLGKGCKVTVNGKAVRDSTKPILVGPTTKIMVIAVSHSFTISGTITNPIQANNFFLNKSSNS